MTITIPSGRTLPLQAKSGGGFESSGLVIDPPSGEWVFQAQSYLAPLTMEAVYPRPDSETRTDSYHRKAHTGLIYRLPIGVRGGCWPYKYEIISGPAGATITGELARSVDSLTDRTLHEITDDYGVLTWDASGATDGNSFGFTVRVTDQLGTSVDLTWNGQVDNSAFVFLDSVAGNDANAGTQASPLQTFANGLWKNSDVDATYAGKIAACSGTFDINAGTLDSSPSLNDAIKPVAFIGNGACTFNTSRGHFRTGNVIQDPFFMGIDFDGSRSDLGNNRIFNFTDFIKRPVFFECSFDNIGIGTSGADNPACIAFMGGASLGHEYIFISKNEIRSGCAVQLIVTFDSNHQLVERNFGSSINILNSNGNYVIHPKDDSSNLTVRANTFIGFCDLSVIGVSNQNSSGQPLIENQEVCYNRIVTSSGGGVNGAIYWNGQSTTPDGQNGYDYRNTVISSNARAWRVNVSDTFPSPPDAGASLWDGDLQGLNGTTLTGAPATVELAATDYDSAGKLTGSARSTYLGTYGAELAGA